MKNNILRFSVTLFFSALIISQMSAQVPQGFNYMAIARDENQDILPTTDLKIRISILRSLSPLNIEWAEDHNVTTNSTGLFTIRIGDPAATPVAGVNAASFSEIDWTVHPLYIRTSIWLNSEWTIMGDAEMMSVPYAMVSDMAYSGVNNPFTMVGDTVVFNRSIDVIGPDPLMDEAIFEVRNSSGQSMFAVYNQGVRINVPLVDEVKGVKGGFAVSGFSVGKAGTTDLFVLNKDSARIYLDNSPDLVKGAKGGFAVGGFALPGAKGAIQDYFSVTPDSARIYVRSNPAGKAVKGGFAVGGFSDAKGYAANFMDITPENYFIGHQAGIRVAETGLYNSVMGYQAAKNLTTGTNNTIIGYLADSSLTEGSNNIVIGASAGRKLTTGNHNTLIGYAAGLNHTTQQYNVMIGTTAGYNVTGSFNTFMGINAGYKIQSGTNNTFLGTNAGAMLEEGDGNTIIGIDAGRSGPWDPGVYHPGLVTSNNTIIGNKAGYSLNSGSGNVFIGYEAGYGETGNESTPTSNKFYLANSSADPPLMYGDFSAKRLGINTKTLGKTLNVGGDLGVTGQITASNLTATTVNASLIGNVTGNVSGNVTGSLSGNVNGMEMGRILLSESGEVQNTFGGRFSLSWDRDAGTLSVSNEDESVPCEYWFKKISKEVPAEGSGKVNPKDKVDIITGTNVDGTGFEIHFGQGYLGFCSVWMQFFDGRLSGHYTKY